MVRPLTLSGRAAYLRLRRADGAEPVPTVWRCVVNADDVLGYFGQRHESELVLDPETIRDIEAALRASMPSRPELTWSL